MNISQVKLKVLERCTGHKKVEEWTFLPKDWNYDLVLWSKPIHFDKNFALLEFDTRDDPSRDDILILNLVTRKSFWMRSTTVETQVKEKAADQIDLGNFHASWVLVHGTIVENDRLLVQYKITLYKERRTREEGAATIG